MPKQLLLQWQQVRAGLLSLIEQFDDGMLLFVPSPAAWPIGRTILHIAEAEAGWIHYAVRRELPDWPEPWLLKEHPTLKAIEAKLAGVHTQTEHYLASLSQEDLYQIIELPWRESQTLQKIFCHVIEHEIHHRGELSLALRLIRRRELNV